MLIEFTFNQEIIERAKQLGFKVNDYTVASDFVVLTRGNEKIMLRPNESGGFYEVEKSGIPLQKVSFQGIKNALGMNEQVNDVEDDVKENFKYFGIHKDFWTIVDRRNMEMTLNNEGRMVFNDDKFVIVCFNPDEFTFYDIESDRIWVYSLNHLLYELYNADADEHD
jgi:hypothetical protein